MRGVPRSTGSACATLAMRSNSPRAGSVASNGQAPIAYFPAHVKLEQTSVLVEGKRVPVSAGMNVTAEIRTGQRTLLDYRLSPIQRTLDEGARER